MPRCRVCDHPRRKDIDATLVANTTPVRRIAADFSLTESSLRRHRDRHLPVKLARSAEARRVAESDDLGEQVRALRSKAFDLLHTAEVAGDARTALAAIGQVRGLLELQAKVQGQIDSGTSVAVSVQVSDTWPRLRSMILTALEAHPEARASVLSALERAS